MLAPPAPAPVSIHVLPPMPLVSARRHVLEPSGDWTLADVAAATGLDPAGLTISVDGKLVDPDLWSTVRPGPGSGVIVGTRPGVEGIAALAAVIAEVTGVGTVVATIISTAVALAALYGLSALSASLLAPSSHDADATATGVRRTITGNRNEFRAYEAVPQVLGRHRLFPPLAARFYTAVEDGNLYQYALLTAGHGPLEFSDVRIGEEPVFKSTTAITYTGLMKSDTDAFGANVVQCEFRQGGSSDAAITLFARDAQEQIIGQHLRKSRGWIRRRTLERATRIVFVIGCPYGLIWRTDSGKKKSRTVRVALRYRAVGASAWIDLTRIKLTGKSMSSVYAERAVDVAEGTYECEVKRLTEENTAAGIVDRTDWATLLVHRAGEVVNADEMSEIAVRYKITNAFAGIVNQFNLLPHTVCLDWNGSTWVERATRNPASLFRHVLQGPANARPVEDARIDLVGLAAWHEWCETNGFEFNYVTQGETTVQTLLRQIATAGRASLAVQDGKFTVVREHPLTGAPVQYFTPRNVRSWRSVRTYVQPPEAFKVQWVDPESGYLDTERIVPDDGFTELTASTFERLDLAGITDPDQAYKIGRYHLAVLRLRPDKHEIETDFEHLDCVRGDWVRYQADVILVGLAAGRVVSVTLDGSGDATGVVLDQSCPMEAATTYGIRCRKGDGTSLVAEVTTVVGEQTTLTFATPIDSADPQPEAGDLFLFGESGSEDVDAIVSDIQPIGDLGAQLTLVDANPAILTADDVAIPAYDPQITIPPDTNPSALPAPRVTAVSSTEVRDQEARGPVTSRGLRVRLQPSGVQSA